MPQVARSARHVRLAQTQHSFFDPQGMMTFYLATTLSLCWIQSIAASNTTLCCHRLHFGLMWLVDIPTGLCHRRMFTK
jgi:hypothetical protein